MASNYWTHGRFLWSHCIVDVCLHKETVVPLKWILPKPAVRTASHLIYMHSLVNTYRRTLSSSASSSFLHLVVFPSLATAASCYISVLAIVRLSSSAGSSFISWLKKLVIILLFPSKAPSSSIWFSFLYLSAHRFICRSWHCEDSPSQMIS